MKVTLIDVMGDDLRVANAARVSFHKESEYESTMEEKTTVFEGPFQHTVTGWHFGLKLSEGDQKLIKYLATHNHWTPFSHVQITMREEVPIFVARQRFKHMVGFTYNEVSRRYVDDTPKFFVPDVWRKRAENKKQGSLDEQINTNDFIAQDYKEVLEVILEAYNLMLEHGVAPEQARMVLPQSMYTEYFVTGSLAAWARAYKLRIDPHSQKEIQDLAKMWGDTIGGIKELQYSWKALTDA